MDLNDWLESASDPPFDPRLFEDCIDYDGRTETGDLDPGDATAIQHGDSKTSQPPPRSHTPHFSIPHSDQEQGFMPPDQQYHHQAANASPTLGRPTPSQASPPPPASHWQTPQDLDQFSQTFETFHQQLLESARSPDLAAQDLDQTPSRYHYPDPPTRDAYYTNPQDPSSQYLAGPYTPGAEPNMEAWNGQFYGDGQEGMFVPQQTDFVFSPPGGLVQPLFPDGDDSGDFQPTGRQGKGKGQASSTTPGNGSKENPECIDCGKRYRTSTSEGRCTRCSAKYERRVAQPFTYSLDPEVPDFRASKQQIFKPIPRRNIYQDDIVKYIRDPSAENRFVQLLLDAINVVQDQAGGSDNWSIRQQKVFNEKAKMEKDVYNNAVVTARIRALYREILNYHLGGEAVYAFGGDNSGYADDRTLRFSQRVATICEVLRKNKRVVMDVIEGRGVQGFVSNPKKYHERKASNNNCNVEKKRIMEKGKEIEAELGSVVSVTAKRGKRARTTDAEGVGELSSNKRQRGDGGVNTDMVYASEYEGCGYGPGKPMQNEWLSGYGRRR